MSELFNYIDSMKPLVITLQKGLTSKVAIAPESDGDGECEKADYIKSVIKDWGFSSIEEIKVPDNRVSSKVRPTIIATIKGEVSTNLWIITHTDVVPSGEKSLWNVPPFEATVEGDKIYGRGTEDNQQSLVSSLIAAKTILDKKIKPYYTVKLMFVADEEVGSVYGIQYILENKNLFSSNDLILTPDGGDNKGSMIEVAEKSILWLEFTITGKQSHGSRPDLGINSSRASSHLVVKLEGLYKKFNKKDKMYDLPYSTFEPTKRHNNIENINTIPGAEILCYDCRVLPDYSLDEVIKEFNNIKNKVEKKFNVNITYEIKLKLQAPEPTKIDSEIVKKIQRSVKKVLNVEAKPVGIGGGTVAAYFRMKGYSAALWSTIDSVMHKPNEYSKISNTLNDAKVFLDIMLDGKA